MTLNSIFSVLIDTTKTTLEPYKQGTCRVVHKYVKDNAYLFLSSGDIIGDNEQGEHTASYI